MQKKLLKILGKLCTFHQQQKRNKFEIFYQQPNYKKIVDKVYNELIINNLI
jgi:ribosomal protein L20A (L18A)